MSYSLCDQCSLPFRELTQKRTVDSEPYQFCCLGCAIVFQVSRGHSEEAEATWLLLRLGVGAFLSMNIMLFSLLFYSGDLTELNDSRLVLAIHLVLWALATLVVVILGSPFMIAAAQALRTARVTSDSLVSLGVLAAYVYSTAAIILGHERVYFDTLTMILVLYTLGHYIEAVGRANAMRDLAPLLTADQVSARVIDEQGQRTLPATQVLANMQVRILPGEYVPVDGVVLEGCSYCEESLLTGEASPRYKNEGSQVFAGSLNNEGHLLIRASASGKDTLWGQMASSVREALLAPGDLQRLADRAASIFVPFVLLLAVGVTAYWSAHGLFDRALMTGLAVLVVACPCALGLATPLATGHGIALLLKRGGLIRGGAVFEILARAKTIVFDKTGTLTQGAPELTAIHTTHTTTDDTTTNGTTTDELLAYAAGVELGSEHPLARTLVDAAQIKEIIPKTATNIRAHTGAGVTANHGDLVIAIGNARLMKKFNLLWPSKEAPLFIEDKGALVQAYIGWSGLIRGVFTFSERKQPQAKAVITALHQLNLESCLLSGDNSTTVSAMASALGIHHWQAGLSPEEKCSALDSMDSSSTPTIMVGDGLNDGPVLAIADVGIAVPGATGLARAAADVHLPADGIQSLPWLISLARQVRLTIRSNLTWAFGYNFVALVLAASGVLQPVLAAALMAGSSLFIVLNTFRLSSADSIPVESAIEAVKR